MKEWVNGWMYRWMNTIYIGIDIGVDCRYMHARYICNIYIYSRYLCDIYTLYPIYTHLVLSLLV